MQVQRISNSRFRRTVNDLVVAEMFLLQATIESATAIGDGINDLGRQFSEQDNGDSPSWSSLTRALQRLSDQAIEPYSSRYRYFRDMINNGD